MSNEKKNQSLPAFPIASPPGGSIFSHGLTKREYMAAEAMKAIGPHLLAKGMSSNIIAVESSKLADNLIRVLDLGPLALTVAKRFEFFKIIDGQKRKAEKMEVLKFKGDSVEYTLEILDEEGNPATLDGPPNWSTSPEGLVSVAVAEGGLSAIVTRIGPAGNCKLSVIGDARIGEGVVEIIGEANISLPTGEAKTIKLTPKMAPAPVPEEPAPVEPTV